MGKIFIKYFYVYSNNNWNFAQKVKITRFYRKYNRENLEMMIKEERNKVAFHKLVFDLCKQNYDI